MFETSMARPRPKSGQVPPPPGPLFGKICQPIIHRSHCFANNIHKIHHLIISYNFQMCFFISNFIHFEFKVFTEADSPGEKPPLFRRWSRLANASKCLCCTQIYKISLNIISHSKLQRYCSNIFYTSKSDRFGTFLPRHARISIL